MDDVGLGSIHWLCVVGSLQERGQSYSVLLVCSVIPETPPVMWHAKPVLFPLSILSGPHSGVWRSGTGCKMRKGVSPHFSQTRRARVREKLAQRDMV